MKGSAFDFIKTQSIKRIEAIHRRITQRTDPILRQVGKSRSRWDVVHRITLIRVVSVATVRTDIPHFSLPIFTQLNKHAQTSKIHFNARSLRSLKTQRTY